MDRIKLLIVILIDWKNNVLVLLILKMLLSIMKFIYLIVDIIKIFIVFLNLGLFDWCLFLVLSEVSVILVINNIMVIKLKIIWVIEDYLFKKIMLNNVVLINCIFVEIGIVFDILIKLIDLSWFVCLNVYNVLEIRLIIIIVGLLNFVKLVISKFNLIMSVFSVVLWIWL